MQSSSSHWLQLLTGKRTSAVSDRMASVKNSTQKSKSYKKEEQQHVNILTVGNMSMDAP